MHFEENRTETEEDGGSAQLQKKSWGCQLETRSMKTRSSQSLTHAASWTVEVDRLCLFKVPVVRT